LNAAGNPGTEEKRGRNGKCDGGKRDEGTESVTEKYFFLMPKATRELKKKGECFGDN